MTKWIMAAAVVIVLGAGAWWWFNNRQAAAPAQEQATTQTDANGMSPAQDSSNQALVQDVAAIDAQLQGLSSDAVEADASLSDQPVPQSY